MRFKASIDIVDNVIKLQRIVATLAKISHKCVIRFTPTQLHFVLQSDVTDRAARVWSDITQTSIFKTYRIQSTHQNNEILVDISLDLLQRALKTANNADTVTMRMIRKEETPFLVLDVVLRPQNTRPGQNSRPRLLCQQIPMLILHHSLIDDYQEPVLPRPEVSIYMPSLKLLRNVVERMKTISSHLDIAANNDKTFWLRVDSDMLEIRASFPNLQNPEWRDGLQPEQEATDPKQFTVARVAIKHFAQFLHGHQVGASNVICSIVEDKAVILFLIDDGVALTYRLPIIPC
ncbi:hypothetical protein CAOG_05561 [Capsaspora owczarzaki ATCC 30864]|uniref:Checkpoint protein n=1 Tax=Capsaspora owczarzaki (strain ATCC 30864) TaxID=595528 RepID=A0A0D2UIV4_CAPO3|nr:hypothetical protein CAOG_05561 [Capsaspora owczarzaki ATCC 30864]KJE95066.1 hypothetical protein CAOG_005561 [Capsaspora owczarzaki ATCC 30864]|eukprot:XP_004346234.1 hypothetical protein CAOG_05561 [Capsaspora owczarzaki ATCC 30864]